MSICQRGRRLTCTAHCLAVLLRPSVEDVAYDRLVRSTSMASILRLLHGIRSRSPRKRVMQYLNLVVARPGQRAAHPVASSCRSQRGYSVLHAATQLLPWEAWPHPPSIPHPLGHWPSGQQPLQVFGFVGLLLLFVNRIIENVSIKRKRKRKKGTLPPA